MAILTNSEWDDVAAIFDGLWPGTRQLTPETLNLWRDVFNKYPKAWAVEVLNGAKQTSRYFPHMADVRTELRRMAEQHHLVGDDAVDGKAAAEQRERDDHDQRWRDVDDYMAGLADGDAEQHKASAIRDDRRLRTFGSMPVTSKLWKSIVYKRLCLGLAPADVAAEPLARPDGYDGPLRDDDQVGVPGRVGAVPPDPADVNEGLARKALREFAKDIEGDNRKGE